MRLQRTSQPPVFDVDAATERRIRELALRLLRGEGRLVFGHHNKRPVARLVADLKHGRTRTLEVVDYKLANDALAMLREFEVDDEAEAGEEAGAGAEPALSGDGHTSSHSPTLTNR